MQHYNNTKHNDANTSSRLFCGGTAMMNTTRLPIAASQRLPAALELSKLSLVELHTAAFPAQSMQQPPCGLGCGETNPLLVPPRKGLPLAGWQEPAILGPVPKREVDPRTVTRTDREDPCQLFLPLRGARSGRA